jgi:DNA polymerase I-like protein with 3'-5' exonuclease and polymerase domains
MRVAIDIETACGVGCTTKCEHALEEFKSRITVVGIYYVENGVPHSHVFRDLAGLSGWDAATPSAQYVGHNTKFDLKHLAAHGVDLRAKWSDDTLLMAATLTEKIPADWLEGYELERARLNEVHTGKGSHRSAGQHSLKTLAPYFLGVPAFWEALDDKDNDEYVLTDVKYTYELADVLEGKLHAMEAYDFYKLKLFPWTQMLLDAEIRGIALDLASMDLADKEARAAAANAKKRLDQLWAPAYMAYREMLIAELRADYDAKAVTAMGKAKDKAKCAERYNGLFQKACAKVPQDMNLDSPTQLSWLLKDYLGLDITDFHGDESTGKPVLQGLASEEDREDVRVFLEYRKNQKLVNAFFPAYREMQQLGSLHCSFNPTGTRTGRLSSSGPNLQQVPGHLHRLFKARPGYQLATYDMSAIEPRLIAYITGDENLTRIVQSGQDFHGHTTRVLFEQDWPVEEIKTKYAAERKMGKEVGLSFFYGAGANRLQETAQKHGYMWSIDECRRKLSRFKDYYRGVFHFRDSVINPLLGSGQSVANILGRQFRIADPRDVHMQGMNTYVQGSASDMVLNSGYRITRKFKDLGIDGHILLLVHDEIVVEVPSDRATESVEIIKQAMTSYDLQTELGAIPLEVEGKLASSWEK